MRASVQHWGATGLEIGGHMPGDDLIAGEAAESTQSLTLDAQPETVFDHLPGSDEVGSTNYVLAQQVRPQSLVLTLPEQQKLRHRVTATRAYQLDLSGPYTRVVARTRVSCQGPFGSLIERSLLRRDTMITKRQLLSLKAEVEPRR